MSRVWVILGVLCLLGSGTLAADPIVALKISGIEGKPNGFRELLAQALANQGYRVQFELSGEFPVQRREFLLENGDLTVAMMGRTEDRDAKFLSVNVGLTDNLVGKRLLYIPKGTQRDYDGVKTLDDFRRLGKVAGMGTGWADVAIWKANGLPVVGQAGDWKVLYPLIASGNRGIDYTTRGANEMLGEWTGHRELDIEKNLVLVYQHDQILYLTPKRPELQPILDQALKAARDSGLIRKLATQANRGINDPPINLNRRLEIALKLPPGWKD